MRGGVPKNLGGGQVRKKKIVFQKEFIHTAPDPGPAVGFFLDYRLLFKKECFRIPWGFFLTEKQSETSSEGPQQFEQNNNRTVCPPHLTMQWSCSSGGSFVDSTCVFQSNAREQRLELVCTWHVIYLCLDVQLCRPLLFMT